MTAVQYCLWPHLTMLMGLLPAAGLYNNLLSDEYRDQPGLALQFLSYSTCQILSKLSQQLSLFPLYFPSTNVCSPQPLKQDNYINNCYSSSFLPKVLLRTVLELAGGSLTLLFGCPHASLVISWYLLERFHLAWMLLSILCILPLGL